MEAQSIDGEHRHFLLTLKKTWTIFRGHLKDLKSDLSILHQYQWIDRSSRVILIRLNLYNLTI